MDANYTGKLIADSRRSLNMTQKDIAERLHVSIAAVSKWERGMNFPDLALVEPLADILGISASKLLGISEDEKAEKIIRDVAQISALSAAARQREIMHRIFAVAIAAALFIVMTVVIGNVGRSGVPFFAGWAWNSLLPLILGLAAWGFGICAVMSVKYLKYSALSFAFCSAALVFPVFLLDMEVRMGDWSAVEDTIWAFDFVSASLLTGTILLNVFAFLISRKRKKY
ncbi:MAG: helix-turn-helix transcriptional regulator [Oscillospiraceae bacterium]|nr:helix-turn-helix transcriptional regulator [Oscillospiraceae bacterium]